MSANIYAEKLVEPDDKFEAKKYAEGRTIQIEVKTENDLDNTLKLIGIKLKN